MNPLHSCVYLSQLLFLLIPVCESSMQTLIGKNGESVTLPCRYDVNANGLTEMCWGRAEVPMSKCSSTIIETNGEKVTFSGSRRYRLLSGVRRGNVSLTIINVTEEDSGIYGCRVEIQGWNNDLKLNFHLTILKEKQMTTPFTATENTPGKGSVGENTPGEASAGENTTGIRRVASADSTESSLTSTAQSREIEQSMGPSDQPGLQKEEEDHRPRLLAVILVPLLVLLVVATSLFMLCCRGQHKGLLFQKVQNSNPSSIFYVNFDPTAQTPERETATENIYQCDHDNPSENIYQCDHDNPSEKYH